MKSIIASLLLCLAAASPSVAGDLTTDLMAHEKAGWTAWSKSDAQAFKDLISEDAVQAVAGAGVTVGRDNIIADVASHGCEVKGKKLPGKVYSTAVYVRKDGKWRSVSYQETPID